MARLFQSLALGGLMALAPFGSALAYTFPQYEQKDLPPEMQELRKISRGVSAIAEQTSGALVFISISKTIKGAPFHTMDPFDFFFGVPRGGGRRGGPQQPPPQNMPKQQGLGSGFIVDLAKGYIVTNNHVIEGADEISLKLANGKVYDATVVGRDKNTDVAIVKIKDEKFDKDNLTALSFGNSDETKVGDFVVALGAPFGLEASVSFGVVSAVGRGSLGITKIGNFIQTDAAINPGNSGGPLLNTEGRVVGVNTAIFSQSGAYNGIGFAVPSKLAQMIGEKLINVGKVSRGFIGVSLQTLDKELSETLKVPKGQQGALVANVQAGGPADKGGIKAGDVIIAVNGKPVRDSDEVSNHIGLIGANQSATVTVFRDGDKKELKMKLGEYPDEEGPVVAEREGNAPSGPLGMGLAKLSPEMKTRYEISSDAGVVVVDISPDSPVARAGVREGDCIISINNQRVRTPDEVIKLTASSRRLLVRLERQGQYFFVSIRL